MKSLCAVVLWGLAVLTPRVSGIRGLESFDPAFANATQTTFPKVIVKDFNVFMVDEAGKETQLSTSGTKNTTFHETNIYRSENNTYAIVYQTTKMGTNRTITLIESSPSDQLQPLYHEVQYDKPGDDLPVVRPKLFDLVQKKEIVITNDFIDNPWIIEDASWNFRNEAYRFMYYERGFQLARMVEIDMTGNTRVLVEETSEIWVDVHQKLAWDFLNQTDQLVWLSERDNWNHVYLVNTSRGVSYSQDTIKQVTSGEFNIYEVVKIDENEQVMYMRGWGMVQEQEPYHMHVARTNFDGTGFKVLTADADGYHRANFNPDNTTWEDTWSRVDLSPQGALRDANGNKIGELEPNRTMYTSFTNWTTPERFSAPGRDGQTLIYGIIVRPSDFNKEKKYRVIENVYNAPQSFDCPKEQTVDGQLVMSLFQKVADDYDVIVVFADGMGTNWRGRKFQNIAHKNLQDGGFPDRIAWIKAAAAERPWMDLSGGVGIFGPSAGGQSAMGALIWHSDFYSAAMVDAGVMDNRLDQGWRNELWMGWPVDDAVYAAASNVVHANETKGQLLLLVGELDDNVDPSNTYQVVNALNKAGKDYEFLAVPGAGHTVLLDFENVPLQNKVKRFWKNWLESTGQ